jgi:MATE family multidrug resistance protein
VKDAVNPGRSSRARSFFRSPDYIETVRLAWPLIITQVGYIVTGMVDNVFLGTLGPTELGAGILSNNVFVLVLVFCMGMSFSSTPLVSAAHATNNEEKKISLFKNSLLLNMLVACCCFVVLFQLSGFLSYMRQPIEVTRLAVPFFDVLIFSMVPIALFFTGKQFCEGIGNTRAALLISVAGNLLNALLNYLLIYGKWGLPELGYMGSAWASFWARLFMGTAFTVLIFSSTFTPEFRKYYLQAKLNFAELKELWRIGVNSAFQFTFEVAMFVFAGLMAGSLGEIPLDAHGIALSIAGFTYMFANGIAGAATIRVGAAKGNESWSGIRSAAKAALSLVFLVMGVLAIVLLIFRGVFPRAFSSQPEIVSLASTLLLVAAFFQLFDGLQTAGIGILRGIGDVRVSTLITFTGYWLLALPLAYLLAFVLEWGTVGIWISLLSSLVFVSCGLLLRLRYLLRKHGV